MVPLMSQSLERPLSVRERCGLRLHLLVCAWCARYLVQLRLIRRMLRLRIHDDATNETASPALSPAARRRIASLLSAAEDSPANEAQNS